MLYIKDREEIHAAVRELSSHINTPGDLNFAITDLLLREVPLTYAEYSQLIGVLECVKLEFYRRAVAADKDKKIKENGDVY